MKRLCRSDIDTRFNDGQEFQVRVFFNLIKPVFSSGKYFIILFDYKDAYTLKLAFSDGIFFRRELAKLWKRVKILQVTACSHPDFHLVKA